MEEQEKEEFGYNQDLPHEELMDDLGLSYDDLDASIQRAVRLFDHAYFNAMVDGTLSEEEKKDLLTASNLICNQIKKALGKDTDNGGIVVGAVSGIALLIGLAFGIKQITKS